MDEELFGVAGVFICEPLEGGSACHLIHAERALTPCRFAISYRKQRPLSEIPGASAARAVSDDWLASITFTRAGGFRKSGPRSSLARYRCADSVPCDATWVWLHWGPVARARRPLVCIDRQVAQVRHRPGR